MLGLKETDLLDNTINICCGKPVSFNSNTQKLVIETSKKIPSKLEVAPHALKMCEWVMGDG